MTHGAWECPPTLVLMRGTHQYADIGKSRQCNNEGHTTILQLLVYGKGERHGKWWKRTWETYSPGKAAKRIGSEFSSQPRVYNSGLKQGSRTWAPLSLHLAELVKERLWPGIHASTSALAREGSCVPKEEPPAWLPTSTACHGLLCPSN